MWGHRLNSHQDPTAEVGGLTPLAPTIQVGNAYLYGAPTQTLRQTTSARQPDRPSREDPLAPLHMRGRLLHSKL
jgi:hypothetical protein